MGIGHGVRRVDTALIAHGTAKGCYAAGHDPSIVASDAGDTRRVAYLPRMALCGGVAVVMLPEPARVMQPLLNKHMGSSAPAIRIRNDESLFIEGSAGLLEACAVIEPQRIGDHAPRATLWCMSSTGERLYCRASPVEPAILVQRKPARVATWTYERWDRGVLELTTDTMRNAMYGPGASDPAVDIATLRMLWHRHNIPLSGIAQHLDVSARTVERWAFNLGLPNRREAQRDGCDRQELQRLWADPTLTKTAIGQRLDVSPGQLARLARQWELPERTRATKRRRTSRPAPGSPTSSMSSTPAGPVPPALLDANRQRSLASLDSMLERTSAVLRLSNGQVPHHLREAGELRIRHPQASLTELAALAGCSKDAITGRLRRLWALTDSTPSAAL